MPSFTLPLNKSNLELAKAIGEAEDHVKIQVQGDRIRVIFEYGLDIARLDLGAIGNDLTDNDWNALAREIRKTLEGAKVREFNSELIGIHPLRTERLYIRLSPLDKALLEEAAKLEEKTITDFVRIAALRMADDVFDRETARKMEERAKASDEKQQTYVS